MRCRGDHLCLTGNENILKGKSCVSKQVIRASHACPNTWSNISSGKAIQVKKNAVVEDREAGRINEYSVEMRQKKYHEINRRWTEGMKSHRVTLTNIASNLVVGISLLLYSSEYRCGCCWRELCVRCRRFKTGSDLFTGAVSRALQSYSSQSETHPKTTASASLPTWGRSRRKMLDTRRFRPKG